MIFSKKSIVGSLVISAFVISSIFGVSTVYALPYAPGETLDPSCTPGTANCTVQNGVVYGQYFVGTTTATSTYAGGIQTTSLYVTSGTSTFANGINLSGGCFSVNNSCISTSGSGTVNSGTIGQTAYFAANGTTLTATSTLYVATTSKVGINKVNPNAYLDIGGSAAALSSPYLETMLQLTRRDNASGSGSAGSFPQVASFSLGTYYPGSGLVNNYGPATQLDVKLKANANTTESADINVLSLFSNGSATVGSSTRGTPATTGLYGLYVSQAGTNPSSFVDSLILDAVNTGEDTGTRIRFRNSTSYLGNIAVQEGADGYGYMSISLQTGSGSNPTPFAVFNNSTSTFTTTLDIERLNVSTTTATSSFANGINLSGGCYSVNGTCIAVGTSTFPYAIEASSTAMVGGLKTGQTRGTTALDIQSTRSLLTQVASGVTSVALGANNISAGSESSAVGVSNTIASGLTQSSAFGFNNTVNGEQGVAIGLSNTADTSGSAFRPMAFGNGNSSSGALSNAFGSLNIASGDNSSAFGYYNTASGESSSAFGGGLSGSKNIASGNFSSSFGFRNNASGLGAITLGYYNVASASSSGAIGFGVSNSDPETLKIGYGSNAVTIASTSAVGIGTSSPASTLTVTGSACISGGAGSTAACSTTAGTITARVFNTANADLAERYKIQDLSIAAGDVVMLDTESSLTVKKATKGGGTILGIISTNPGFLLGSTNLENTTTRPVALAGRVPVKFSSENGAVKIGDSLALSLTQPGVAMKARSGDVVIGTALEAQSTNGTVTVFVRSGFTDTMDLVVNSSVQVDDTSSLGDTLNSLLSGTTQWMYEKISATTGYFKNIFAHTANLGSAEIGAAKINNLTVQNGITVKDQTTGQFYCIVVDNGVMKNLPGTCDAVKTQSRTSTTVSPENVPQLNTGTSTSPTTDSGTTTSPQISTPEPTPEPTPESTPAPTPEPTPESLPAASSTSTE